MKERFISTSKGTIHCVLIGEGLPIVILHPLAMDHRAMKSWMEPIFETHKEKLEPYQRIYVDLPAHGYSTITADVKTSNDLLNGLLELIQILLANRKFSLVGMSFGGYMAQGVIGNRKDQVEKLCLLAPVVHLKNRTLPSKVVLKKDESLLEELGVEVRSAFETLMVHQTRANWELFRDEIQPGRLLANREFLGSTWHTHGYVLDQDPLQEDTYSIPALLVSGRQDATCGFSDHFPLIEKFPHSTFTILDNAGHMLQIEQRELVQQLVLEWLNRS